MTIAPTLANFLTQTSYDELPEQTLTHVKMISDPAIHRLIDKIQLGSPPTENVDAYRQGTTVTINPYSGEVFTNTVHVPWGAGCLGIEWSEVDAKYRTLMPNAVKDSALLEEGLSLIHHFETLEKSQPFLSTLTA